MKKIIIISVLIMICSILIAETRFKVGITDYDPKLKELKFQHGIYRIHTRVDLIKIYYKYGVGTNLNISFKSDDHDLDYLNQYDLYMHSFHSSTSKDGSYMMYGIYGGLRSSYLRTYSEGFHGKADYRFTRLLCGALVTRNQLGFELAITQNLEHEWKFDWATKYQSRGIYYVEFLVSTNASMKEFANEISLTLGIEILR